MDTSRSYLADIRASSTLYQYYLGIHFQTAHLDEGLRDDQRLQARLLLPPVFIQLDTMNRLFVGGTYIPGQQEVAGRLAEGSARSKPSMSKSSRTFFSLSSSIRRGHRPRTHEAVKFGRADSNFTDKFTARGATSSERFSASSPVSTKSVSSLDALALYIELSRNRWGRLKDISLSITSLRRCVAVHRVF